MRLENLIREINDEMYKKIMDNRTVEEEEAKKTARIVGLAAIKYGDLSNQAGKDYIFDVDRFTSFEREIQVRIFFIQSCVLSPFGKSIRKTEKRRETFDPSVGKCIYEKALMLQVLKFNDVFEAVCEETAPHKLCATFMRSRMNLISFIMRRRSSPRRRRETFRLYCAPRTDKARVGDALTCSGFEAPERM